MFNAKKMSPFSACGTGFVLEVAVAQGWSLAAPAGFSLLTGAGRLNAPPQYSDMASPGN